LFDGNGRAGTGTGIQEVGIAALHFLGQDLQKQQNYSFCWSGQELENRRVGFAISNKVAEYISTPIPGTSAPLSHQHPYPRTNYDVQTKQI